MKKKLPNNLLFLAILLIISTYFVYQVRSARYLFVAGIGVIFVILIRVFGVCQKRILEFLNSPARYCKGKGIEIGSGGSHSVKGSMLVDMVDNFSVSRPYRVDYLADAHHLPEIKSDTLDYVSASHVLEHLTNPIKAILEWVRILKPGGVIWLKIPDKEKTFDRKRERTKLNHLIDDFKNEAPIDDPAHVIDSNTNSDPPRNGAHPYIHNHVWITEDILELFTYISGNHVPLEIVRCNENSCRNAEDFWIAVRKLVGRDDERSDTERD